MDKGGGGARECRKKGSNNIRTERRTYKRKYRQKEDMEEERIEEE